MAKSVKEKAIKVVTAPPEAFDGKEVDAIKFDDTENVIDAPVEASIESQPSPKVIIISGGTHTPALPLKIEGETFEEKLLNYVKGKTDCNIYDLLVYEFRQQLRQQRISKMIKGKLQALVAEKLISIKDDAHLKLGGFYYEDSNTVTQYHTAKNTKIEVTAL